MLSNFKRLKYVTNTFKHIIFILSSHYLKVEFTNNLNIFFNLSK